MRRSRKHQTLDAYELAIWRGDPTLEPRLPNPSRFNSKKMLGLFFLGVVLITVTRGDVGRGAPAVGGSCTAPAFALDKTAVKSGGVLRWSATGPADAMLVIGVDTTTLPTSFEAGRLAGPVPLPGCKATERFAMRAPAGERVVTIFLVAADGRATVLTTKQVRVT